MNPSVLGGGAALLVVLAWLITRRKPVTVLRSTDASAVAALNRAQISQVQLPATTAEVPAVADSPVVECPPVFPPVSDARGRAALLRQLDLQLQGPTAERLAAITTAAGWGDRAALPLLQRGLRDVDPRVVLAASSGMAMFRGRTAAEGVLARVESLSLPRNAAAQG
jgi:hypothetical protein